MLAVDDWSDIINYKRKIRPCEIVWQRKTEQMHVDVALALIFR